MLTHFSASLLLTSITGVRNESLDGRTGVSGSVIYSYDPLSKVHACIDVLTCLRHSIEVLG
jgi:hypothetical protein